MTTTLARPVSIFLLDLVPGVLHTSKTSRSSKLATLGFFCSRKYLGTPVALGYCEPHAAVFCIWIVDFSLEVYQ